MAYATRMEWDDERNDGRSWVVLALDGVEVARMTLDEWSKLSATDFLVEDAVRQAVHEVRLQHLDSRPWTADTAEATGE
jgi:hypothetical protein